MNREELLAIAKPILFNTEMVQAILDNRKSVTRRAIKNKDITNSFDIDIDGKFITYIDRQTGDRFSAKELCRYKVGDILYVRETWCKLHALEGDMCTQAGEEKYYYAADGYNPTPFNCFPDDDGFCGDRDCPRWRPSIHMPKEAARIFLRVTDVKLERLQEITAEQMRKEGLTSMAIHCDDMEIALKEWKLLWDSTIKKSELEKYGWEANPWVWVIEFERVKVDET